MKTGWITETGVLLECEVGKHREVASKYFESNNPESEAEKVWIKITRVTGNTLILFYRPNQVQKEVLMEMCLIHKEPYPFHSDNF